MQSAAPFARIGTRGSTLALYQANLVRNLLAQAHGVEPDRIEIVVITTTGDRLTDRPLSEAGGKGLFTKEIEQALIENRVDLGVHSAKDMPTLLPDGLTVGAVLEREDVRDAFVSLRWPSLDALPEGALFGTSSIRRGAQMLRFRPDLQIVPFRGNVGTRLRKLADGVAEGTLLAVAGLKRLESADRITAVLDPHQFPPAPAQGAIMIEIRSIDVAAARLVAPLDHRPTAIAVAAERAMLATVEGSCRTPIGVLTEESGDALRMTGQLLSPDGKSSFRATEEGPADRPAELGDRLGRDLLALAGPGFLAKWGM